MYEARFPSGKPFQDHAKAVDITSGSIDLIELHEYVVTRSARIELVRGVPGTDACVLITKAELDSLERALEILAETEDVRQMRDDLARVAASTRDPVSVFDASHNGDPLRSNRIGM